MTMPITPRSQGLAIALVLFCLGSTLGPARAQEATPEPAAATCEVDLSDPGQMSDVVSNALHQGLDVEETWVREFLDGAESRFQSGEELVRTAAAHFDLAEAVLADAVRRYHHVNCTHAGGGAPEGGDSPMGEDSEGEDSPENVPDPDAPLEVTPFARDVTLHVILHEMAHALVREFDLPVLGNEETLADAFATHYLTHHLPDRALAVLEARIRSLLVEASEVPRAEWPVRGEHNNDARRAHQIAALAIAADSTAYRPLATLVEMSDRDIARSVDYGAEIHRSWRRLLQPLWMPDGMASTECRVRCDPEAGVMPQLCEDGFLEEIETALARFDWHSQVTVRLVEGDGGAGWSRSQRTITVNSAYVERFIRQGHRTTTEEGGR